MFFLPMLCESYNAQPEKIATSEGISTFLNKYNLNFFLCSKIYLFLNQMNGFTKQISTRDKKYIET